MLGRNFKDVAIPFSDTQFDAGIRNSIKQIGKTNSLNDVSGVDAAVVVFVGEPYRQNTLFLVRKSVKIRQQKSRDAAYFKICFVDSRK